MHDHAGLIDRLGGPKAVSVLVNKKLPKDQRQISPQAVSMWRVRGVSIFMRNLFAEILIEHSIRVPKGFTASKHRGW